MSKSTPVSPDGSLGVASHPAVAAESDSPKQLCVKGQGLVCRGGETPLDTEEEVRRLVSAISRQASRGFTGETWYDFDLPLDRRDPIVILHFNDVYNVDSRPDGSGGVSRFVSAMQRFSHLHPLIFFSGDALNPSLMSTYTKGRHMIPFLNLLKVHTACLGNHDFDFGIDELEYAIGSSNFPWLITNVFERRGTDDERLMEEILEAEAALVKADALAGASRSLTLKLREAEKALASGGAAEAHRRVESLRDEVQKASEEAEAARVEAEELKRRVLEGDGAQQAVDAFLGLPGEPVANASKYRLFDWQGIRIGVIGLVEREWLDTLACVEPRDLVYVDYVVAANRMSRFLRAKECELIIALTHMRSPNDQRLAELATDIDIILGGHDHEYFGLQLIGNRPVLKSGTDFFDFTAVALYPGDTSPKPPLLEPLIQRDATPPEVKAGVRAAAVAGLNQETRRRSPSPIHLPTSTASISPSYKELASPISPSTPASHFERVREFHPEDPPLHSAGGMADGRADFASDSDALLLPSERTGGSLVCPSILGGSRVQWCRVRVTPESFPKNKHVELLVKKYERHLKKQMHSPLASLGCDLETRFAIIRRQESNCGNWLCELMRKECRSDVAILNSGTIRSDALFKAGVLRFGDLAAMLPMIDPLAVVSVTGKILLQVLENSVSQLPKAEGRFLQVAGLRFAFDSSKPPGSRVIRDTVVVRRYCAERGEDTASSSPTSGSPESEASASASSLAAFEPLQEDSEYSLTAKAYLLQGRDGYTMLVGRPVLVEEELLPPLPTLVRNALTIADMANGHGRPHSRIMSRQLSSFRTLHSDGLKTFGCSRQRRETDMEFVVAPKCDGRVQDVAKTNKAA